MGELYQQIFTRPNLLFLGKGLLMTVEIACVATLLSFCFGTLLALVRTYCSGRFRLLGKLVAAYTEFFRCTPNLLWILWLYFTVRGSNIAVSVLAITLFTSAVMCEIFRGGLNAIPKEQFEAAQSQGFGPVRTMRYIILPQMYRKVLPALVGQIITVIKDTSFLKMVDVPELMRNGSVILGSIYDVRGMLMLFAFEGACYFIVCFSLSCVVRGYQKRIVRS